MLRTLFATLLLVLGAPAFADPPPPARVGINVTAPSYFGGSRAFSNLLAGAGWRLLTSAGADSALPADRYDATYWPSRLRPGERAAHVIDVPTAALRGQAVEVICRWQGKAVAEIWGPMARGVKVAAQSVTFTFDPALSPGNPMIRLGGTDPAAPLRDVDCREAGADPAALFDPTFLAEVGRFSAIRFMKWAPSVESNRG